MEIHGKLTGKSWKNNGIIMEKPRKTNEITTKNHGKLTEKNLWKNMEKS